MALPATIQTIVAIIGHGPTMNFVREFGGDDFRFPRLREGATWESLVEIIGERLAILLVERFKGDKVYIALCKKSIEHDRKLAIIARYDALLKQGHSSRGAVSIIVREFRPISNRNVENIVNRPMLSTVPEMVTQGRLF